MNDEKEVYFDQYCKSCKHRGLKESKDPCNDCLAEPSNTNSHKPMNKEKIMNIDELRKAISSEATEENEKLKAENQRLRDMKAKTILDTEKKDAIDIATELCYSEEVKKKLTQAKSVYEIGRILKQARLDQE
jgi:regulator of replication initiation timing